MPQSEYHMLWVGRPEQFNHKGGRNMRITSKIIQNNALSNINNNKLMENKYQNQMSTGKKILRFH